MPDSPVTKRRYTTIGIALVIAIILLALPSGFAAVGDGEGKPATPELETALKKITKCHISVECHAYYDGYWGPQENDGQSFPGPGWEVLTGEFKGCTFKGSDNYTSDDYTSVWEVTVTLDETASYVTSFKVSTFSKDTDGETKRYISGADDGLSRIPRIGESDLPKLLQQSGEEISKEDYEILQKEFSQNTYYVVTGEKSCYYVDKIEYSNWSDSSDGRIETNLVDYKCNADSRVQIMFFGSLPEAETSFTLQHFHPFDNFLPGQGTELGGAGDLWATLKDGKGEGVPGKKVFFYLESGTNLQNALKFPSSPPTDWIQIHKYLPKADIDSYLGHGYTNSNGLAVANYINNLCVSPLIFSQKLVSDGKLEGNIRAVVMNEDRLAVESEATVPVKFEHIAQILEITGEGQPDTAPPGQLRGAFSGPGRVRITRLFRETFTRREVADNFRLMPGDIINIDGGVSIEIAWLNGDRVKVKVPKYLMVKDNSVPVPDLNIILLASAYDSGFYYDYEKVIAWATGLTIDKGIDLFIKKVVPFGETGKDIYDWIVDIRKAYAAEDFSKIDLAARIRIRSTVVIDTSGDEIEVFTIEGSPDIQTAAGAEITLKDQEMVAIYNDGTLSEIESFEPEQAMGGFTEPATATTGGTGLTIESRSKPLGSTVQIPITLTGVPNSIGNMDITLEYDPSVLEITEVVKGSLTANALFDYNIQGGVIKVSLADSEGFDGNGSLIYIKGNVIGAEGSSSSLRVTEILANGIDYETLDIATIQGEFRVTGSGEQLRGDYNGDGRITTLDALCALQMAEGERAEDLSMDVNADGKVTSDDARLLLEQAVTGR